MQHSGERGGSLQVVKAARGAIRIAGNSEGDVGLHTAAAWLCASAPMPVTTYVWAAARASTGVRGDVKDVDFSHVTHGR